VRVDESWRDDEPAGVDRPFPVDIRACGVADEGDPVRGDRHVPGMGRYPGPVDDASISNEEVGRRTLSGERALGRGERSEAHESGRDRETQPASQAPDGTNGVGHRAKLR
jgi:hypothetical protein